MLKMKKALQQRYHVSIYILMIMALPTRKIYAIKHETNQFTVIYLFSRCYNNVILYIEYIIIKNNITLATNNIIIHQS